MISQAHSYRPFRKGVNFGTVTPQKTPRAVEIEKSVILVADLMSTHNFKKWMERLDGYGEVVDEYEISVHGYHRIYHTLKWGEMINDSIQMMTNKLTHEVQPHKYDFVVYDERLSKMIDAMYPEGAPSNMMHYTNFQEWMALKLL